MEMAVPHPCTEAPVRSASDVGQEDLLVFQVLDWVEVRVRVSTFISSISEMEMTGLRFHLSAGSRVTITVRGQVMSWNAPIRGRRGRWIWALGSKDNLMFSPVLTWMSVMTEHERRSLRVFDSGLISHDRNKNRQIYGCFNFTRLLFHVLSSHNSLKTFLLFQQNSCSRLQMAFIITTKWKHEAWNVHTAISYLTQAASKLWINTYLQLCCITPCKQIHWRKRFADTVKIALIWIFPPASFLWRAFDILIMTIREPTGNRDTALSGFIDLFCGSGMEIKVWIQYHNITLALRIFSRELLYYTTSLSKSSLSGKHYRPDARASLSNCDVAVQHLDATHAEYL